MMFLLLSLPLRLCVTIIAHACISLDVDRDVVLIRLKEGMSSVQCSMRLKKIAEDLGATLVPSFHSKWK